MTSDSADRELLAETTSRLVASHAPVGDLEKVVRGEPGHDPEVWRRLCQLGAAALLVPEEAGGTGHTMAEVVVVGAELGRNLVPGPFLTSAVAATSLVADASPSVHRDRMLEQLAGGELLAAPVAGSKTLQAWPSQEGSWTVDGQAEFVLDAAAADVLVVHTDDVVLMVSADQARLSPTPMADQTRRLAAVGFAAIVVPPAAVLATGPSAAAASRRSRLAFELAVAADAVGGAEAVLALAVDYAKTRRQFDRAIGSFQGIKHKLADMHVLVESAKAILAEAGEAWGNRAPGDPLPEVVTRAAVAYASAAYVSVAGDAIQVHGGIGFTWEHPCHRYFKRAWLDQALVGGSGTAQASFADVVIDRARRSG